MTKPGWKVAQVLEFPDKLSWAANGMLLWS